MTGPCAPPAGSELTLCPPPVFAPNPIAPCSPLKFRLPLHVAGANTRRHLLACMWSPGAGVIWHKGPSAASRPVVPAPHHLLRQLCFLAQRARALRPLCPGLHTRHKSSCRVPWPDPHAERPRPATAQLRRGSQSHGLCSCAGTPHSSWVSVPSFPPQGSHRLRKAGPPLWPVSEVPFLSVPTRPAPHPQAPGAPPTSAQAPVAVHVAAAGQAEARCP